MDGLIGVEPIFTNPEFVVLPLDDSPLRKRYFIEFCFKKSIRAGGILKFCKILIKFKALLRLNDKIKTQKLTLLSSAPIKEYGYSPRS